MVKFHTADKMVDAFLGKKYKLASSENFDEFMKALGKFSRIIKCTYIFQLNLLLIPLTNQQLFSFFTTFNTIK